MSGGDAKVACQQCSETFGREDVNEVYDEQIEVCGFICNSCCIKSAEFARRCQISDCKTKPDSGPTGFRTLPSKFYDLQEGEVKRRIIKQFGIFRNVRACCNMCYVRISKSIVQMKIVYGDGLPRSGKPTPRKTSKHATQSIAVEKASQNKDDRLAEYTGPKFTRRSGSAPSWDKIKLQTEENIVPSNVSEILGQRNESCDGKTGPIQSVSVKVENEMEKAETAIQKDLLEGSSKNVDKESPKCDTTVLEDEKTELKGGGKTPEISYSSTPISPTSMRFRRIQPKIARFDGFDLSSDLLDGGEPEQSLRWRKRSKGNDDETWSPGRCKKEKMEGKGTIVKREPSISSNVMSDFVSCTGCQKICCSKETFPVFDEKKGTNIRLCNDCVVKKNKDEFICPIKSCTTPKNEVVPMELGINLLELDDIARKQMIEMGISKDSKTCENCFQKIKEKINGNVRVKETICSRMDDEVFTMCRNCNKIVPMKNTTPNIEEDGRKCGVLCQKCSSGKCNLVNIAGKKAQRVQKKVKTHEQSMKTIGFCTAKGCVHAGEKEPVQLVSGKKILQNYLDEKMLRAEFDLADDTDYCCRSCHARIKWFVADIKKKESGNGADSKNSLKNLTPKLKSESDKGRREKVTIQNKPKMHKDDVNSPGKISKNKVSRDCNVASQTIEFGSKELPLSMNEQSSDAQNESHILETIDNAKNEFIPVRNISGFQQPQISNFSSKTAIIIPPVSTSASGHPSVLHVGGQQFVLNVISRSEKECQTHERNNGFASNEGVTCAEKGVQVNIPLMPKFEGTVPANLPNGKKVKYADAKEKTKYAVKRAGKELLDQFLQQLDEISGGCAQQLLSDIYHSKEVAMATNYEKILSSIGTLYRNTDKLNRQERLRLLSTVALHAPNEALKRYFQRDSKKGDLISVNEAEIVQAREYAKQYGPGIHVMPIGQVSWKNFSSSGVTESPDDDESNECVADEGADSDEGKRMEKMLSKESDVVKEKASNSGNLEKYADGNSSSNNFPVTKKDGDKHLITLEKKMKETGLVENGTEQLVTFKVTVRHAKDKTSSDSSEAIKVCHESKGGMDDCQDGEQNASWVDGSRIGNEAMNGETVLTAKRRKRKSEGILENGEEIIDSQKKKLKRRSLEIQSKEKSKSKHDCSKGDSAGDLREKRTRTAFNIEKKTVLEKYFDKNIYASKTTVEEISKELGIDKKKIDNWFRNRRSKLKKDEEEKLKRNVELKTRKGGKNNKSTTGEKVSQCVVPPNKELEEERDFGEKRKSEQLQKAESEDGRNKNIESIEANIEGCKIKTKNGIEKNDEFHETELKNEMKADVDDDRKDLSKEKHGNDNEHGIEHDDEHVDEHGKEPGNEPGDEHSKHSIEPGNEYNNEHKDKDGSKPGDEHDDEHDDEHNDEHNDEHGNEPGNEHSIEHGNETGNEHGNEPGNEHSIEHGNEPGNEHGNEPGNEHSIEHGNEPGDEHDDDCVHNYDEAWDANEARSDNIISDLSKTENVNNDKGVFCVKDNQKSRDGQNESCIKKESEYTQLEIMNQKKEKGLEPISRKVQYNVDKMSNIGNEWTVVSNEKGKCKMETTAGEVHVSLPNKLYTGSNVKEKNNDIVADRLKFISKKLINGFEANEMENNETIRRDNDDGGIEMNSKSKNNASELHRQEILMPAQLLRSVEDKRSNRESMNELLIEKEKVSLSHNEKEFTEPNENIVQTSWSSVADGSEFSLVDDYEVEEDGGNVREDLALALNNDPDFMNDLSELMNIAKT